MPKSSIFAFKYDSLDTIESLIAFNESVGIDLLLKQAHPNLKENKTMETEDNDEQKTNLKSSNEQVSQYKEISKTGDICIAFEHYRENYLEVEKEKNRSLYKKDDDDDDDNDDDDDEVSNFVDIMPSVMRFGAEKQQVHYTPWGKFDIDNPLSPVNLYDLRAVHFKGFTSRSIPNFSKLMGNIEGVAIWGQIDPYFVVIAPAKSYDFAIVRENVERAIYGALNIEIKTPTKTIEDYIIQVAEKSASMFVDDGIENFALIFPNEDFSVEYIENPTEENVKHVCSLFSQIENLIIFKNGEIYEC